LAPPTSELREYGVREGIHSGMLNLFEVILTVK